MKKDLDFKHDEFKNVSDDCKTIIQKFLKKDPIERIRLEDAVKDKWFDEGSKIVNLDFSEHKSIVGKITEYKKANLFTKAIKLCMSKI